MRALRTLVGVTGSAVLLLAAPAAALSTSQDPASVPSASSVAGQWTSAGNLLVTRDHPQAVLLRDGRVLVVGGTAVRSKSAELYDPATATSTVTAPTHVVRFGASIVRLFDGHVLLVGGIALRNGRTVRAAEIYHPETGTWDTVAPMHRRRAGAAIMQLPNGGILVAGGIAYGNHPPRALRSAEIYRPVADRWVATSPMRWPHGVRDLQSLPAATLRNGDVLVVGGIWGDVAWTTHAERYDVSRGLWVPAGRLPSRRVPALIRLGSGTVLAIAGYDLRGPGQADPVFAYLPRHNRWVRQPDLPGPFGRPGVVRVDGRPFVVGECSGTRPARPCPAVARYRPKTKGWRTAAPLPDSRQSFATVRLPGGDVLVIAGTYKPPKTEFNPISSVLRWSTG